MLGWMTENPRKLMSNGWLLSKYNSYVLYIMLVKMKKSFEG